MANTGWPRNQNSGPGGTSRDQQPPFVLLRSQEERTAYGTVLSDLRGARTLGEAFGGTVWAWHEERLELLRGETVEARFDFSDVREVDRPTSAFLDITILDDA